MKFPDSDAEIDSALEEMFRPLLGRRLALCVSGGADSMALMHLVARWSQRPVAQAAWREVEAQRQALKARSLEADLSPMRPASFTAVPLDDWMADGRGNGAAASEAVGWAPVVVLTVDHGLRPESADEAAFVAREAARLGFPHRTLTWRSEKPSTGVQQAARTARYGLMSDLLDAECWAWADRGERMFGDPAAEPITQPDHPQAAGKRILVTAHHVEDQAETFLMRLARGTTLDGLTAMRPLETFWTAPERSRSYRSAHQVARPLLGVSKAALTGYLKERRLVWREDPTNRDEAYERVRIRGALPVLEGLGISADAIGLTAARLARARDNVRAQVMDDVHDAVVPECAGVSARVLTRRMAGRPLDQALRLLRYVLAAYGGASKTADYMQLEVLADRLCHERPVHKQTIAGCILVPTPAQRDGAADDLLVWREPGRIDGCAMAVGPGHYVDWDGGRFRITAAAGATSAGAVRPLGEAGWRTVRESIPALHLRLGLRGAFQGLPAVWDGERLVCVPSLETIVPSQDLDRLFGAARQLYNAEFRGNRLGAHEAGRGES